MSQIISYLPIFENRQKFEKNQKVAKVSKKPFECLLGKIHLYFFSIFNIELMQLPIFESVGAYLVAP